MKATEIWEKIKGKKNIKAIIAAAVGALILLIYFIPGNTAQGKTVQSRS